VVKPAENRAVAILAIVFFSFLYVDEQALNRFEDRMQQAVTKLPPQQRVLAGVRAKDPRGSRGDHLIDRVCIEQCFSYGNYEPSSGEFRVRATGRNPIVLWENADVVAVPIGKYVVKKADLPLYIIGFCAPDRSEFCLRQLKTGDVLSLEDMRVFPTLW
jgi:hypothetical protein